MKYALLINVLIITVVTLGAAFVVYNIDPREVQKTAVTIPLQTNVYAFESENLIIGVEYPVIPGNSPKVAQANAVIRQEINKDIDEFRKGLQYSLPDHDSNMRTKSSFEGKPTIIEQNARYMSVIFTFVTYSSGAAHPSHNIKSYVFDFKNERMISLVDMFRQNSNYLPTISRLSREGLMRQSSSGAVDFELLDEEIKEGTKPTTENFRNAVPSKGGLVVVFPEYQVAPYAAGPQQVILPYSELQEIIDPKGILEIHLK